MAAFLLFATVLVFLPENAFRTSSSEIGVSLGRIVGLGLTAAVASSILLATLFLALPHRNHRIATSLVVVLAFLFYLQGNVFLWNYGLFSGKDFDYDAFDLYGIGEVIFWSLALLLGWLRAAWISRHLMQLVGFLLAVQVGTVLAATVMEEGLWETPPRWERDDALFEFSENGNVVILVLDGFKGPLFQRALATHDDPPDFQGFTHFTDVLGAFNYTYMSVPAMLSGESYQNQRPIPNFLAEALGERSIAERLAAAGYMAHASTDASYCSFFRQTRCSSGVPHDESGKLLAFFDFVLFRGLPHYAKKPLRLERSGLLQAFGRDRKELIAYQHESLALIEAFERRASVGAGSPTFKFIHLMLPHSPWVLGADCEPLARMLIQTPRAYLLQAGCSLRLAGQLLQTLERIGLYESSLLVIVSDHGAAVQLPFETRHAVETGRAQPLVLVKPPGARGALRSDATPISLTDLPATVAELVGLQVRYPGQSLFGEAHASPRTRRYYEYSSAATNGEYLPPIQETQVRGPIDDPASWSRGPLFEWSTENDLQNR